MPPVAIGAVALAGAAVAAGGVMAALAATGLVGVVANFGASMLLSGIAQALVGKPKARVGVESRQVSVREPASPRQIVYGETRKGGSIVYITTSGNEPAPPRTGDFSDITDAIEHSLKRGTQSLHLIIVLAGHPLHEINEVYFDGELAFNAAGEAQGKYAGKARLLKHYGHAGEVAFRDLQPLLQEWTPEHSLTGCAAIALQLDFHADTYPNGIPNVSVAMKGRRDIYDPRTGTRGYSSNAALCVANYLEDARYGLGAPIDADVGIRIDHLIEAANICDELVDTPEEDVTEARYACNGVVDVSASPQAILESLLSAMAGKAIFKGGRWSIHAGAYRAPTLHLGLGDLAGPMQLTTRMSRSENFNGVRGKFISPSNDWQPDDFPAVKSAVYLAEDNGTEVWRDINLPFTTSPYAAQRIAKIELELARRQHSLALSTKMKGLATSAGETITFTHPRWGWAEKPLVVASVTLQAAPDGQGFTPALALTETSPLVYDWDASEAEIYAAAPRTYLLPPWYIAAPGITKVSEELYLTRQGDGVLARAIVDWSASDDPRVGRYELQASTDGETWRSVGETIGLSLAHEGWAPGPMQYRVRAIGLLGQRSDWAATEVELTGLLAPPEALTGATLQSAGGLAILKWQLPADLDVRIGGRVVIRHSHDPLAGWPHSVYLDEVPGQTTIAVLPLMPGAYYLRPVDGSGQFGPVVTLHADGAQVVEFASIGLLQEDDEFSGSHSGTIGIDGALTLLPLGAFEDVLDVDALVTFDAPYGVGASGSYAFATGFAWPAPRLVRLRSLIEMQVAVLTDDWDDRALLVDDLSSWDAQAEADCDVVIEVRTTQDNPAGTPDWSGWSRLDAGEYLARGVQARALLSTQSPELAPVVTQLRVHADEVA